MEDSREPFVLRPIGCMKQRSCALNPSIQKLWPCSYVRSLCLNLEEIQAAPDGGVTLSCDSDAIVLDIDVVTALGIVVAEVVTNSYDHAFPGGNKIVVSVHRTAGDNDADVATMTISTTAPAFRPKPKTSGMDWGWCGGWPLIAPSGPNVELRTYECAATPAPAF
jgi:hypothetical protein